MIHKPRKTTGESFIHYSYGSSEQWGQEGLHDNKHSGFKVPWVLSNESIKKNINRNTFIKISILFSRFLFSALIFSVLKLYTRQVKMQCRLSLPDLYLTPSILYVRIFNRKSIHIECSTVLYTINFPCYNKSLLTRLQVSFFVDECWSNGLWVEGSPFVITDAIAARGKWLKSDSISTSYFYPFAECPPPADRLHINRKCKEMSKRKITNTYHHKLIQELSIATLDKGFCIWTELLHFKRTKQINIKPQLNHKKRQQNMTLTRAKIWLHQDNIRILAEINK